MSHVYICTLVPWFMCLLLFVVQQSHKRFICNQKPRRGGLLYKPEKIHKRTSTMENHGETVLKILAELEGVLVKTDAVDVLSEMVAGASYRNAQIFLHGVGREGLMLKGFAMRLFHLGLNVHCIGDMTTPPIASNDLLILSAGPGSFSTVKALASVARSAGGKIAVLTAQPDIAKASIDANTIIAIPAQTMANHESGSSAPSVLPLGSLYEGAMFLVFEMCIVRLREKLQISTEAMRSRHTNLE